MKRDISLYLKDVFENMKHLEVFIENLTYEEFIKDKKTSYAVVRCIEIIGEAVKNIPDDVREKYPDIPWKKMASDMEIREKGLRILFKNLGEADAIRFLSQITFEKRDYLKLQDELFEGMSVEDIYKKAKEYAEKKKTE
jgi:uncharacterized protein with HEPN domain